MRCGAAGVKRAVEMRGARVGAEYAKKAKTLDQDVIGVAEGEVGPVQAALEGWGGVQPLVFGAFGEVNAGMRRLAENLAALRAKKVGGWGRNLEGEKSIAMAQVRQRLSLVGARARARMLLDRMSWVGPEGCDAMKRRQKQVQRARQRELEQEADSNARRSGAYFAGMAPRR